MTYVNMVRPELAQRYMASGLWTDKTFFEFIDEAAAAHPEREVFADAHRRISYGALKDEILRCAELYRRIGIKRGDVVTVQLPNWIEFAVAFFALELIGAIANKVNPDFRARELDYILKFSGSSAYVFPREFRGFDFLSMAKSLRASVPGLAHLIVAGEAADGIHSLASCDRARHLRPSIACTWTPTKSSVWPLPPARPAIQNACCTASTPRFTRPGF